MVLSGTHCEQFDLWFCLIGLHSCFVVTGVGINSGLVRGTAYSRCVTHQRARCR